MIEPFKPIDKDSLYLLTFVPNQSPSSISYPFPSSGWKRIGMLVDKTHLPLNGHEMSLFIKRG